MVISPIVIEAQNNYLSPVHQSPYYFSRVPIPIQLKPYYKANQNYLFFMVLNKQVRIKESDGVLIVNLSINVLGDFRLPPNFLILDVSSNIGEFNNITLNYNGIRKRKIGQHDVKINNFTASFKINLNDVGYARKEVVNKEIVFKPQIHLNSNINNFEEQINFENWPKSLVYEEIYNSMKDHGFKYIYKNVFDLKWTPVRMHNLNFELYSKPFLGFDFRVDELNKIIEVNQKIKDLFNLYAFEHDIKVEDLKNLKIDFELNYKSLFNNEPKKLHWSEDESSIVKKQNEYRLEIKNKFKYDFVADELKVDNINGFEGIWLPNNGIFELKTKITANTKYGKQIFNNSTLINVVHNLFRYETNNPYKIKVKRAIIKNYENFKTLKN